MSFSPKSEGSKLWSLHTVSIHLFTFLYSGELQKPVKGQPTVDEVLESVLRECRKESMVYKLAALHAAGEILEATQTDRFAELSQIIFPIIKKVLNTNLISAQTQR